MPLIKKATCCYCGTHVALRLSGKDRHELQCSNCGAPLTKLKMLPMTAERKKREQTKSKRPQPKPSHYDERRKYGKKPKKSKYRKGFARKIVEEVWDAIEDVFD